MGVIGSLLHTVERRAAEQVIRMHSARHQLMSVIGSLLHTVERRAAEQVAHDAREARRDELVDQRAAGRALELERVAADGDEV